jgi:hypothetical protein
MDVHYKLVLGLTTRKPAPVLREPLSDFAPEVECYVAVDLA